MISRRRRRASAERSYRTSAFRRGDFPPARRCGAMLHAPRSLLIIDAGYLMKGCNKRGAIDYVKFVQVLEAELGGAFYEKFYLDSARDGQAQNNPFHRMLRSPAPHGPNFRVELYGLKKKECKKCKDVTHVQKGVDVAIATLLLKHAFQNLADRIVLFTGDGDFKEALRIARDELRKEIVLVGFNDRSLSTDITQLARTIWIDGLWPRFVKEPKVKPVPAPAPAPPVYPPAPAPGPTYPPNPYTPPQPYSNSWDLQPYPQPAWQPALQQPQYAAQPHIHYASQAPPTAPMAPVSDHYPCPVCTFHRGAPIKCAVCEFGP